MNLLQPGIVLLNKPSGVTSFQALGPIKQKLGTKKVGHSGTLDKFANGLMVLLTNKATKLVPYLTDMDKVYKAKILFGTQTDTLDPEGQVIDQAPLPTNQVLTKVPQILDSFLGTQDQIPPMYSALHINGKRAYELVRSGKDPEMKPRQITIHKLEILDLQVQSMELLVHCSKGTYIRSLARDIAHAMDTCGHLSELTRTKVGSIDLSQAVDPKNFLPAKDLIKGKAIKSFIPFTETIELSQDQVAKLVNGVLVPSLVRSIETLIQSSSAPIHRVLLLFASEVVGFVEISDGRVELAWNGAQGSI
jgi:tRNA pseudouridine55 synthase